MKFAGLISILSLAATIFNLIKRVQALEIEVYELKKHLEGRE